jgi:hypothetical protein
MWPIVQGRFVLSLHGTSVVSGERTALSLGRVRTSRLNLAAGRSAVMKFTHDAATPPCPPALVLRRRAPSETAMLPLQIVDPAQRAWVMR